MAGICCDVPTMPPTYEWATLMLNFNQEISKSAQNWWPWVTGACYYRGKIRRQIQIVMSELLVHNRIDPWQILGTDLSDQFDFLPLPKQKEWAKIYCTQLMYIVKESIKQVRK